MKENGANIIRQVGILEFPTKKGKGNLQNCQSSMAVETKNL